MFLEMMRFEWRYQVRRPIFALLCAVVCFMAFAMVRTGYSANGIAVNAPYAIMQSLGLLSLWTLLSQTILTVTGALRDDEHGMRELVLSRPVGRLRYVMSRYLGIVLAGMMAMTLAALVMMVAAPLAGEAGKAVGPMRLLPYLWGLATVILPDLLLVSSLLFAVAVLTRRALATYVGGIAIFALYIVVAMMVESPLLAGGAPPTPEGLALGALLDPFGLSALFEQTRYWTPAERNTQLVALDGRFLVNRLLWSGVATVVLFLTYRFASFGRTHTTRLKARATVDPSPADALAAATAPMPAATARIVAPTVGAAAFWPALRSTIAVELRQLYASWLMRALLLLWGVIIYVESAAALGRGEYGTRLLATSALIVGQLAEPLTLVATLCIAYFGAEVVWRERALHFDALIDATPASNGVFHLAKLAALCSLPLAFTAIGLGVGAALQAVSGGMPVLPAVFFAQFWFVAYPLVLFAVVVITLHVLTGNRWVGLLAAVALAVLVRTGAGAWLEHPMLRFGAAPPVAWSDLDGFGPAAASFGAFMLYWTVGAVLLLVIGARAWPRGRSRVSPAGGRGLVLLSAVGFVATGALLFRATERGAAWEGSKARLAWSEAYERSFRRLALLPQPGIAAVDLQVDLDPAARRAQVRGVLALENPGPRPIDTIWVTMRRDLRDASIAIDDTHAFAAHPTLDVRGFALERPLRSGERVTMRYAFSIDRGSVRASGFAQDVAANGTYLDFSVLLPALGYRAAFEIDDPAERAARRLGAATTPLVDAGALDSLVTVSRERGQPLAWLDLHLVVSTSADQVPLAPGRLVRQWREGTRNVAEFRSESHMTPVFAVTSGRFVVARARHGAVNVEFWHHAAHAANAAAIVRAATDALDILGARFGPYPHRELRIVEVPSSWRFGAFAMPGMIAFTEDRGILTDPRTENVDLLLRRVAHEVAHQWWGHAVSPLPVAGASTVVESLAKYSEQLVVASVRGDSALPAMLAYDEDRYLSGRAGESGREPLLREAGDESYIYYGKGTLAFHAIDAALGRDVVTGVLREFLERERGPRGAATAPALHARLRDAAATRPAKALVDEWFAERVIHDLQFDTATVSREGDRYRLRATFSARRVESRDGVERATRADAAMFEVRVTDGANGEGRVLHAGMHAAVDGMVTVDLLLDVPPVTVEIDPRLLRIDRDRSNNRGVAHAAGPSILR